MAAPSICGKIEEGNLSRNGGSIPPFPDAPRGGCARVELAAASRRPRRIARSKTKTRGTFPETAVPSRRSRMSPAVCAAASNWPRRLAARAELSAAKRKRGEPLPKRRFHPAVPGCPPRCVRPRRFARSKTKTRGTFPETAVPSRRSRMSPAVGAAASNWLRRLAARVEFK